MNILQSAKLFATQKHVLDNKQLYGSILPYTHHPQEVEQVLIRFGWEEDINLRCGSWLHDVIEDTRGKANEVKIRDIRELFGDDVAALVDAVTTVEGENRKIRNALTYPRIRAAGIRAVSLKLADRTANVEFSLANGGLSDMYREEHPDFRHGCYISEVPNTEAADRMLKMWHYLNGLFQ